MLRFLLLALLLAGFQTRTGFATPGSPSPRVVPVWPERPPGEVPAEPESDLPAHNNDDVRRTTNVSVPTITVYSAPDTKGPKPAVLICPGGGYNYLAINKEGSEIAEWLNSIGVTGIVLKYRVPNNKAGALQDAQRALALIRSHSSEWAIDPNHIGVIGFSAGGHLAASVAAQGGSKTYPAVDKIDEYSSSANFAVLVYPAYLLDRDGNLAAPFLDASKFPPTFFAVTQDDQRCAPGCVALYQALTKSGIKSDLHIFSEGGHAWGLRHKSLPVKMWPTVCAAWLASLTP